MMKNDQERPEQAEEAPPVIEVTGRYDDEAVGERSTGELGSKSSLAYAGIVVSAIVLLVALTADFKDHKYYKYGLSVGSIALILAVLGWIVAVKMGENHERFVMMNNSFLFAWCFIGACFMTFNDGPFKITGNGYFGSWGLAVFATMALGVNASSLQQTGESLGADGPTLGLFVASIILMTAISSFGIDQGEDDYAELVYSLVVTIVTILVCAGIFLSGNSNINSEASAKLRLFVMGIFAILWVTAACLLTFRGPFLTTSNGYFGAWGGAVASIFAVNAARRAYLQT